MSAKKQIMIVGMVFIVVAVALIFVIGRNGDSTIESRLEDAQAYYDMLDYDKAIAIYNNVLRSEKKCVEAYLGLADVYIVKGNNEKALEVLERGLSNVGDDSRIVDMLSELSEFAGEQTIAEAAAEDQDLSYETTVPDILQTEETTSVPESAEDDKDISAEPATEAVPEAATTVQTTTTAATTTRPPETAATTKAPVVTAAPVTTTAATTAATTAKPTIEMPNLIGMDKDEAVKLAKQKNISLTLQYDKNDMYANNIIYYQSHRAGTMVSEQTAVEAYVCVNDQKQVTEDDLKVQEFYNVAKEWGTANSDKVKSVTLNEKNATVTIVANSIKKFVIDESVIKSFAECNKAVLVVNSPSMTMSINSSSVTKSAKVDLSANTYGNESRVTLEMGASGSLNCTVNVTLTDCNISSSDLAGLSLYKGNKKSGTFSVNYDGKPVISVSNGGQYVIR